MTLPAYPSAISMSQVNTELGLSATANITLNNAAVRSLFGKPSGAISMSDGHGKSSADFTISPAWNGKTSWSLGSDGFLNIGTTGVYVITMLKTKSVQVSMWGGGGAAGGNFDGSYSPPSNHGDGGGGGYAYGGLILNAGSTYTLYVGRGGRRNVTSSLNPNGATYLSGGVRPNNQGWGSEGGGYSGISSGSGNSETILILAGGGGGGSDNRYSVSGGAGGGTSGQNSGAVNQGGNGGTSSAGGSAAIYNSATAGSYLTGGLAQNAQAGLGGGGGGYYGGGGGNVGGGGGGSGYGGTANIAGSGSTPGYTTDPLWNNAGKGGTSTVANGSDGRIVIY